MALKLTKRMLLRRLIMGCMLRVRSWSHGLLTFPESTVNGNLAMAGNCAYDTCMWYSDFVEIPGEPTVNKEVFRTFNVKVESGSKDWSRKNPWRAPGTAPVFGSGCGIMGGMEHPVVDSAGQFANTGQPAGKDGAELRGSQNTVWEKGGVAEVGFAITANHGGGYSYRLCPKSGAVTEECFQKHTLKFANDKHKIVYGNMTQAGSLVQIPTYEIPMVKVTQGTYPRGSEWVRNPIPSCKMFDQNECMGLELQEKIMCAQVASGYGVVQCPPNMVQFPEPLPGLSGHVPYWWSTMQSDVPQWTNTKAMQQGDHSMGFPFSIMDQVHIPDLPDGDYFLSWRWDSEQSAQVWQNCADIRLVTAKSEFLYP